MPREPRPLWSEERFALFKKLFDDGLPFSQIASQIGVTRSAAIGKAHRLGLMRGQPLGSKPGPKPKRQYSNPRIQRLRNRGGTHFDLVAINKPTTINFPSEDVEQPVNLLSLRAHHCRWPVSGTGIATLFCAATRSGEHSYCYRHCQVAYRDDTPASRKRKAA